MSDFIWLVSFLPLGGAIVNGLLGMRFPKWVTSVIACSMVLGSFVVSCVIFFNFLQLPPEKRVATEVVLWQIFASGDFIINLGFLIDPLSLVMLLLVSALSFFIHVYSILPLYSDEGLRRYFVYLNLFVFFMLTVVSASNFFLMFLGWEGVTLCAYLMISFWYHRQESADAGKKIFIINLVGDYGLLLGLLLIFVTFGSLDFLKVLPVAHEELKYGGIVVTMITLLLFVGIAGKSALIPFHVWLPDTTEAPTPPCALLCTAMMVTAGVYLTARCGALYLLAPFSLWVVAGVGAGSALFAVTIGLAQTNLKTLLAYLTLAQLGYMFLACGSGGFAAGIFHLMIYSFSFALLFLCSGSIISFLNGEADIRTMDGSRKKFPVRYALFLIAVLGLTGVPPLSGFFSLTGVLMMAFQKNFLLGLAGIILVFLTSLYLFRGFFMIFYNQEPRDKRPHKLPMIILSPLIALGILTVGGGWIGLPAFFGGGEWFQNFLALSFTANGPAPQGNGIGVKVDPLMTVILVGGFLGAIAAGISLAYYLYHKRPKTPQMLSERFKFLYRIVANKYYVNELYNVIFVQPIRQGAEWLCHSCDDRIIDAAAPQTGRLIIGLSSLLKRLQTGCVQHSIIWMVVGIILLLAYYLFS